MVSTETAPGSMVEGANALAIDGAVAVTVRFAVLDAGPVAACVLETPEAVFGFTPADVPRTTTVTVQESDAGIVRPVNVRLIWFAAKTLPPRRPRRCRPPGPPCRSPCRERVGEGGVGERDGVRCW